MLLIFVKIFTKLQMKSKCELRVIIPKQISMTKYFKFTIVCKRNASEYILLREHLGSPRLWCNAVPAEPLLLV